MPCRVSVLPEMPEGVVLSSAVRCRAGWAAWLVLPALVLFAFVLPDGAGPLLAVVVCRAVVSEPALLPVDEDEPRRVDADLLPDEAGFP